MESNVMFMLKLNKWGWLICDCQSRLCSMHRAMDGSTYVVHKAKGRVLLHTRNISPQARKHAWRTFDCRSLHVHLLRSARPRAHLVVDPYVLCLHGCPGLFLLSVGTIEVRGVSRARNGNNEATIPRTRRHTARPSAEGSMVALPSLEEIKGIEGCVIYIHLDAPAGPHRPSRIQPAGASSESR
jgi:hypothetical protein